MERRTSATARIFAALALVAAVVAVIVVVSGSSGESPQPTGQTQGQNQNQSEGNTQQQQQSKPKSTAKVYVVKSGDTLSAISEETGVSVAELQTLNPEVDALTLVEGETLKLR